jgi:hypothetical protein
VIGLERPLSGTRRAITGPNFCTQLRTVSSEMSSPRSALGEEILDVSVAEREAQVEPDRMLDDNRRRPVTTVWEFHHPVSLLAPPSLAIRLS